MIKDVLDMELVRYELELSVVFTTIQTVSCR